MRIACLIRDEPALRFFANRLDETAGVDLLVVERPAPPGGGRVAKALAVARSAGPGGLGDAMRERFEDRAAASARGQVLDRWFGDRWLSTPDSAQTLPAGSVNDPAVVARLRDLEPDVILDHGTSIVGPAALAQAPLALNLHWGLSPYYRGTRCTAWALINWDPYNIGVTIHKLSQDIDGGAIAAQARATVTPGDTVFSINMQLTSLGTELALGLLESLEQGRQLRFVDQDFSQGILTYNRQWTRRLGRHVASIERDGTIGRMLESPAREHRLPIVAPS